MVWAQTIQRLVVGMTYKRTAYIRKRIDDTQTGETVETLLDPPLQDILTHNAGAISIHGYLNDISIPTHLNPMLKSTNTTQQLEAIGLKFKTYKR